MFDPCYRSHIIGFFVCLLPLIFRDISVWNKSLAILFAYFSAHNSNNPWIWAW